MTDEKAPHEQKKTREESDDDFILKATVIGVDPSIEPIKSFVVGDHRDKLGRRLGALAVGILILFFLITSYIQSARNGEQLTRAAKDRSGLIHSINHLAESNTNLNSLVKQLQDALREQNKILSKAGYKTVRIPGTTSTPPNSSGSTNSLSSGSKSSSNPKPGSTAQPKPSPSRSSQPSPKPSPSPINDTRKRVCDLTGICLSAYFEEYNDQERKVVRSAQVYRSGVVASPWYVVLCLVTDLGFAGGW